jgi:hypothetical protein
MYNISPRAKSNFLYTLQMGVQVFEADIVNEDTGYFD